MSAFREKSWELLNSVPCRWYINNDPGGWADIDIYLGCDKPEKECAEETYSNCGCIITESTSVGLEGIEDIIERAVARYHKNERRPKP